MRGGTLIIGLLLMLVAGCGGGGETTTDTGSSEAALTKAQFIKQGDAICREAEKARDRAAKKFTKYVNGKTTSDRGLPAIENAYVSAVLPNWKRASEELSALNPPADDEQAAEILEMMASGVKKAEEDPRTGIEGKAFEEVNVLADEYGFKVCGSF